MMLCVLVKKMHTYVLGIFEILFLIQLNWNLLVDIFISSHE